MKKQLDILSEKIINGSFLREVLEESPVTKIEKMSNLNYFFEYSERKIELSYSATASRWYCRVQGKNVGVDFFHFFATIKEIDPSDFIYQVKTKIFGEETTPVAEEPKYEPEYEPKKPRYKGVSIQDLKLFVLENGLIRPLLEEIGCTQIVENNKYYSCANADGDNPQAIQVYKNERLTTINHTRVISESRSASLLDLISFTLGITFHEAIVLVKKFCGVEGEKLPEYKKPEKPVQTEEVEKKLTVYSEEILEHFEKTEITPFLKSNISSEIIDKFGVLYDNKTKRIAIPIRDERGQLVGIKGRSWNKNGSRENKIKYLYILPCEKSKILYGLDKSLPAIMETGVIYLVESEKAVMQLFSYGIKNTAALSGSSVSEWQLKKLKTLGAEVRLVLDKDVVGAKMDHIIEKIASAGLKVSNYEDKFDILEEKESPSDRKDAFYQIASEFKNIEKKEVCYMEKKLESFLQKRGVENPEKYLKLDPSNPESFNDFRFSNFKNSEEAVKLAVEEFEKKSQIYLLVDKDLDGMICTTLLHSYLRKKGIPNNKIKLLFHSRKEHGLTKNIMCQLEESEPGFLILADSSSNDVEQQKNLNQLGYKILILDHHELNTTAKNPWAVVINSKDDFYPAPEISGATVVFHFLEALDQHYGTDYALEYYDLIAFSLIGDSCDIKSEEVILSIKRGLKHENIKNPLFKFLIKKLSKKFRDSKNIYQRELSFTIIPVINSIIRMGTIDHQVFLLQGFLGYLNEEHLEKLYTLAQNLKKFQKDLVEELADFYHKGEKNEKGIIFYDASEKTEELTRKFDHIDGVEGIITNTYGIVASKLSGFYDKPAFVVRYYPEIESYGGSARTCGDFNLKDNIENEYGLFAGHQGAFGVRVSSKNLEKFIYVANLQLEQTYTLEEEIDFIYESFIPEEDALQFADWYTYCGSGINPPKLKVTNFRQNITNVKGLPWQGRPLHIFFNLGPVEYLRFYNNNLPRTELTGVASFNVTRKKPKAQIIIERGD